MSKPNRTPAAFECGLLLCDAVKDLLLPQHLDQFAQERLKNIVPERYINAWRRVAVMSVVMAVYRLSEARERIVRDGVFTDQELRDIGFIPVEDFVGDWSAFMMVRGQYVGHSGTGGGRLLPPRRLGEALRRARLRDDDGFLTRVREELVPPVERVRDLLFQRYPGAEEYYTKTYPDAVAEGGADP